MGHLEMCEDSFLLSQLALAFSEQGLGMLDVLQCVNHTQTENCSAKNASGILL